MSTCFFNEAYSLSFYDNCGYNNVASFSIRISGFLSNITAVRFKNFYYENLNNFSISIQVKKYSLEIDGKFNQHVNK